LLGETEEIHEKRVRIFGLRSEIWTGEQKWVPGIFLGVKDGRPARKVDNLTAICEPIV
jgi:hypothetical protein